MTEVWKDVSGYKGLYQVSNHGNVRSTTRYKKILKPQIDKDGYRVVTLKHNGEQKHFRVCRLVALAFIQNPHGKETVNHSDLNRQNDFADNLEWSTQRENVAHSAMLGRYVGVGHKPVIQSKSGKIIMTWPSLSEASRALNIPASNISKCLSGERKRAGGFEWSVA